MAQEEMWTNDGPPIYLDANKIRVVDAESPDAAFLLVAEGGQIPLATAKQYALTEKPPGTTEEQTTMNQVTEAPPIADQVTEAPPIADQVTDAPAEPSPDEALAERLEAERLEAERRKAKAAPNTKLRETPDNKSGQG